MDIQTVLPVLLSWVVHLSDYGVPEQLPVVQYEPHAFFVENVCGGRECNAVGWYNDQGIIYIDAKYKDDEGTFAASLLTHELTHYVQHQSGKFDSLSCEDSLAREREAYRIQNEFILQAQASFALIRPAPISCMYASTASHDTRAGK